MSKEIVSGSFESWIPLGGIGEWLSGGTPDTRYPGYWDGDTPWISAASLKTFDVLESDRRLTRLGVMAAGRLAPPGSVVFVVRGMSLANEFRVGVVGRPVAFGQDCKVIIPRGDVDGRFLAYFLLSKSDHFVRTAEASGHGTKRLVTRFITEVKMPRTSLSEQRRIVEVLDAADEAIGASADCVDKLSRLRGAALAELMGHGFALAQGGLKRGASATSYGDSRGGVSEEDRWQLLHCAEVLKLTGGSPALIDENREGKFPVYGGNGIVGYVDRPLVGGDVLIIGRVGQYSGAVYYSHSPAWVTDNALYSKIVYGDWDKRFLALYLKWFDLRKRQSLNDNPLVTQASISRVPVAQPPLGEQKRIVSIIEAHDERIAAEKARLEKLRKLKAGLMDDLLTGRVRVDQLDELPV